MVAIDFITDFDEHVTAQLQQFGYRKKLDERLGHRYCIFYDLLQRRVIPKQYRVHYSRELKANTLFDQFKVVISELRERFNEGESVEPYLSERVNHLYPDKLLVHWKIHHFHLSSIKTINAKGFVRRADYILFARVEDDDVYFIDIKRHDNTNEFEDATLLEIVDNNWSELLLSFEQMSPSIKTTSDKQIKQFRKSNVNHLLTVNGRVVMASFGTTASGSSTEAINNYSRIHERIIVFQKLVRSNPLQFFDISINQCWLNIKLVGIWEKGFDIHEVHSNQRVRVKTLPD